MNCSQKNGTLFVTKNSNIVPCTITDREHQKLADRLQYNLPDNLKLHCKI